MVSTERKKSQPGWEDPERMFEMNAWLSSKSVSVQVVGNGQEEGKSFSSVDSLEKHSRWSKQSAWILREVKKGQRKSHLVREKRQGAWGQVLREWAILMTDCGHCAWTVGSLIALPSDSYDLLNLSSSNQKKGLHLFVTNKITFECFGYPALLPTYLTKWHWVGFNH